MQIQSLRNEPGWDVRKRSLRTKKLGKEWDSVVSFAAVISVVTQRCSPLIVGSQLVFIPHVFIRPSLRTKSLEKATTQGNCKMQTIIGQIDTQLSRYWSP